MLGGSRLPRVLGTPTWLMMRFADAILRVIGANGAGILIRVMGMILAALSVELVMEAVGIEGWVSQPSR